MNLPSNEKSKLLSDVFFSPMEGLFDKAVNELFNDFKPFTPESIKSKRYPKIDIVMDGDDYVIDAAVPFVSEKNLSVVLDKNILTIKGKVDDERKLDSKFVVHREFSRSSFSRSLIIPEYLFSIWSSRADFNDCIDAELKEGILTIRLKHLGHEGTKIPEPKTIEIKT